MKLVELQRSPSSPTGTFGRWYLPWLDRAWPSLELPWADNEPQHSCIVAGTFRGVLAPSSKWSPRADGRLYHIVDVPGRNLIKVHAATWAGDEREGWFAELLGCIAPGEQTSSLTPPGYKREQACILRSRAALREIMDLLEGDDIELKVSWDRGAEPRSALA